jgi:Family of unknown function (DUF5670)
MRWTFFLALLIAWALGLASGYTLGHFIHVLPVIALVVLVLQLQSGPDRSLARVAGRARRWTRRHPSEVFNRLRL